MYVCMHACMYVFTKVHVCLYSVFLGEVDGTSKSRAQGPGKVTHDRRAFDFSVEGPRTQGYRVVESPGLRGQGV